MFRYKSFHHFVDDCEKMEFGAMDKITAMEMVHVCLLEIHVQYNQNVSKLAMNSTILVCPTMEKFVLQTMISALVTIFLDSVAHFYFQGNEICNGAGACISPGNPCISNENCT